MLFWARSKYSSRAILARALLPAIESLEIRRLFQSCSVSGGLMTVIGNETNDDITIAEDGSHKMLIRNHGVEINHAQCYVLDTIPQIYVDAYWGNDIITVLDSVSAKIQMHLNGQVQDDTIFGGPGNDLIEGGAGNDILFGAAGDDTLDGGSNTDILNGGPGADRFIGGPQHQWPDVADYSDRNEDLNLSIDGIANDGAAGEGDYIDGTITVILAGSGNDRIVGLRTDQNSLIGGLGDDTIIGGDSADTLDGGGGNDWIDYGYRTDPLVLDLTDPIAENGNEIIGEGDMLLSIENVIGGHGPDTITGTDGRNIIYAGSGDDIIDGNGDDDQIYAQADNDIVTLKTKLPTYPLIDGGDGYDILDMIAGSYSFSDDASAHGLEQINLSKISTLSLTASQHLSMLNIFDSSLVSLAPDSLAVIRSRVLNVSPDSVLNLTDNGAIIDSGNLSTITNLIKTGLASGVGIVGASLPNRRLGIISNSNGAAGPLYTTFQGEGGLIGQEILILYTLIGDLNLDRTVSIADFIDLSAHFNESPSSWRNGDVNYDDTVSINDFIDLSSNFGQSFSGSATPQPALSTSATTTTAAKTRHPRPHHRQRRAPNSI